MRKTLFLLMMVLLGAFTLTVMAQEDTAPNNNKKSEKGIHPYKDEGMAEKNANWSIMVEGGMAFIDGDFQQNNDFIPYTAIRPSGGIFLEYSFSPMWGLAVGYNYANFGCRPRNNVVLPDGENYLLFGHMHSAELNLTFNFINAWFPNRSKDIFNLYFLAGAGVGFYKSYYFNAAEGYAAQYSHLDKDYSQTGDFDTDKSHNKYNATGLIDLGLAAEFNVTRGFAIGLKGVYKVTMTDKIDTRIKGSNNDNVEYAALTLRWKIAATKKNHVRNYASDNAIGVRQAKNASVQKDTIVINNVDTIYSSRIDTLVLVSKEINTIQVAKQNIPDQRYYVYFDVDKYNLNDQTLIGIQQFAQRLLDDTTLCVEVSGYCDHTGTEAYNEKLAQQRAEAVTNELISVYGIASDRLLPVGKGKLGNVKKAYGPNRRVEMRFVSKEDLEKEREELKKKNTTSASNAATPTASNAKDGINTNVNTDMFGADSPWIDIVTTRRGMSLAKLARKYYNGKTDCWVYIYEANQGLITNPDKLNEGLNLMIPRLTEEQVLQETLDNKLKK